jgi:hypothetical protein
VTGGCCVMNGIFPLANCDPGNKKIKETRRDIHGGRNKWATTLINHSSVPRAAVADLFKSGEKLN